MKFSGINGLKKVLFPKAQTKKKKKDRHANCTTQNNKPDKIGGLPKKIKNCTLMIGVYHNKYF